MRIYITIIMAALMLSSCNDDFLDVKPKGKFIPSTVADYEKLLNHSDGVTRLFIDNNNGCVMEHLTDNISYTPYHYSFYSSHPNKDRFNAYRFEKPYMLTTNHDNYWNDTYAAIAYLNNVVEGVKGTGDESSYAKGVLGQAIAARAYLYLHLVNLYSPVYIPNSGNDVLAIPIMTSPDIAKPIPDLSTIAGVYDFIEQDLSNVVNDIPARLAHPSKGNRATGHTILANLFMMKQEFSKALEQINMAWDTNAFIDNYNSFTVIDKGTPVEQIVGFDQTTENKSILFYRSDSQDPSANGYGISSDLVSLIDKDNDLRYQLFYSEEADQDGVDVTVMNFSKFKMERTIGYSNQEILITKAELEARTGDLTGAVASLNMFRSYRYKTGTPAIALGTMTADDVIDLILKERRIELAFLSVKRFMDLRRLVLDEGKPWAKSEVVHKVGTTTYTGVIKSEQFHLNLPEKVKELNPQWNLN